jgi:ubiquinone/menaquinone biosynthesis C-methylase UbiE
MEHRDGLWIAAHMVRPGADQSDDPVSLDVIPEYLQRYYWWAYIHPTAVRLFERPWLVNLILWGNYRRLTEAALCALGGTLPDRSLQIACVYGDLTARLAARAAEDGGQLDVIDVLAVQLANLRPKLPPGAPVRMLQRNSAALGFQDASYDRALLFFLCHEQPAEVRRTTVNEALRVVRPGGRVVIVDYAWPRWWQPMRHLWLPLLRWLEPFVRDLWVDNPDAWLPLAEPVRSTSRTTFFGGLYQLITITR